MIVLDTNVLSEPLRARPDPTVLGWLDSLTDNVAITAISVGEILSGVRALPRGRRRDALMSAIERTLADHTEGVLPYDDGAARTFASMQESRRAAGRPLSVEDGMIAAICGSRGYALATRNIRDFDGLNIALINPWIDAPT